MDDISGVDIFGGVDVLGEEMSDGFFLLVCDFCKMLGLLNWMFLDIMILWLMDD